MTAEVIGEAQVIITADFSTFDDELKAKLTNAARRAGADAEKILKRSGKKSGTAYGDEFDKTADGASLADRLDRDFSPKIRSRMGRSGRDSGGFFRTAFESAASRGLGRALFATFAASAAGLLTALSPLSTVLGGATAAVVALAAALATASGSAISLAGVLGSLGLAAVALKIGFSGLGDAMDAQSKAQEELARTGEISKATQEKLDEALKKLAPSARAVVKQLGAMAPAWQAVQRSIQQRLFAGVSTALANLGNRFLPVVTRQLGITAGILNTTALAFGRFLNTSTRAQQFSDIFGRLNSILQTLLAPATAISGAFLNVFQASLPFAQQLATVLQGLTLQFAGFLNQAVNSGAFTTFMETAMTLAGNLFQLLGNIGSIIGSVFSAGTAAGGNLLTILRDVTGQFAQFLKSAEGQSALASFFGLIGQAAQVLVGIFRTLQPLLSGISSLFTDLQGPIRTLGTALTGAIGQIANTLGAILTQLGPVIGQLVTAFAPLVTIIGGVLAGALAALAPVINSILTAFTQLLPVLTPLVAILGTALVTTLQQLSGLLVQIVPVLTQFIAAVAAGLQPVLAALQPVLAQIVAAFVQLVVALLPILTSLLPLVPVLAQLSLAFVQLVIALTPLITSVLTVLSSQLVQLAPFIARLIPPIIAVIQGFTRFILILTRVVTAVVGFVVSVIAKINEMRGQVLSAVSGMISGVVNFFSGLPGKIAGFMATFASKIQAGIDKAVGFFRELPGKVTGAISGLSSALFTAGAQAVAGLVNGIKSKAGAVLSAAQDLASKVKSGIGGALKIFSPSRVTTEQGEEAGQGLANGILNKIRAVTRAATDLANAVPTAVGKALTKVNSSLISLSNSLPAGAKRRIDAVVSAGKTQFGTLAKASDALDAKLKTAQTNLQSLLQKSQQLAQSVAQSILQSGNIAQGQDQSFVSIVNRLKTAVTQARQFNSTIAALSKAGLNQTSLQQIIDAGPEAGLAAGQAILAAGRRGVAQINTLQNQLQTAANKAAKTASDAIFGQGIQIANGIVAGLRKQKASLDQQMLRLADVLVTRVIQVLRALNIPGIKAIKIPGLKDGGVVQGKGAAGTLRRVGEYGRAEAVIPLTRPKRARELMDSTGLSKLVAGSNGKSKTVEVPIHVAGNLVDYEALTAHIERVLQRYGLKPALGIVTTNGAL